MLGGYLNLPCFSFNTLSQLLLESVIRLSYHYVRRQCESDLLSLITFIA